MQTRLPAWLEPGPQPPCPDYTTDVRSVVGLLETCLTARPELVSICMEALRDRQDVEAVFYALDEQAASLPASPQFLQLVVRLAVRVGDFEVAKKHLQTLLQTDPTNEDAIALAASLAWVGQNGEEAAWLSQRMLCAAKPIATPAPHPLAPPTNGAPGTPGDVEGNGRSHELPS